MHFEMQLSGRVPAMRYTTAMPLAATVALTLTVAGCSKHDPEPPPPTPAAAQEETVQDIIGNAAAMLLKTESMHVRYSTADLLGLTAPVYDAQVSGHPPSSTGDATLLVDDKLVHASFTVTDGKLAVGTEDGGTMDMGDASGKLNPPALLDQQHGLSSLLGSLAGLSRADKSGTGNDPSQLRLEGKLPSGAATLLVPTQVIGEAAELPVTVWFDQTRQGQLSQLITRVGGGSVTLQITDTKLTGNTPSAVPPVGDTSSLPPLPLPDGSPPPGAPLPPEGAMYPPPLPDGSPPPMSGPPSGAPFPPPVSGSQAPPAGR